MRSVPGCLLPALAAALGLAACGSSTSSSTTTAGTSSAPQSSNAATAAASALVRTAANSALGATVLTDSRGMTLYRLSGEQGGKFICASSSCLAVWHPVSTSAAGTPSAGVASLGTVRRPDGTEQVTYKGMPLYTFTGDQQAGEAKGQGLKDVGTWSAATVSASTGTTGTQSTSPPTTTSTSGGYRY